MVNHNSLKPRVQLAKLKPGDTVSVISPSAGLPGRFPHVFELGLDRLQNEMKLNTKEYPCTRKLNATPEERAGDVMAAFCDPETTGVFAAIGGCDQILVLNHLNAEKIAANPKPFFGFSDNTNIHIFLGNLGIPSYYGGHVMNQFAFPKSMWPLSKEFAQHALFDSGSFKGVASETFCEVDLPWSNSKVGEMDPILTPTPPLIWNGRGKAQGVLWGGCFEIIATHLMVRRWLKTPDFYQGMILVLETSEDMPSAYSCWSTLTALGELGMLSRFAGMLVGRPKAWSSERQLPPPEREPYRTSVNNTIVEAFRRYNISAPVVLNLDFGHTEPQIILPLGNSTLIDCDAQVIEFCY